MAKQGRINPERVQQQTDRRWKSWQIKTPDLPPSEDINLFDRQPPATVIDVCRRSASLSRAGRDLFATSRLKKATANDAARLREYLARSAPNRESVRRETKSI